MSHHHWTDGKSWVIDMFANQIHTSGNFHEEIWLRRKFFHEKIWKFMNKNFWFSMTKTFKSSIKMFDLATPATARRLHQRADEYSRNVHRAPPSSSFFFFKNKNLFLITSLRTSSRRKSQRATKTFSAALSLTLIIYDNVVHWLLES